MNAILLAFSLIRVPRLFVSLLLLPLVVGLGIAILQAATSSLYFGVVDETAKQAQLRIDTDTSGNKWLRTQLFDSAKPLGKIQVCDWSKEKCEIKKHDIVIKTDGLEQFNLEEYKKFFQGSTRTLHLCNDCTADIVVTSKKDLVRSDINNISGLGVIMLTDSSSNAEAKKHFVEAKKTWEHFKDISGTVYLHTKGLDQAINMSQASKIMMLIMNTALIAIIAIWLSLRGHRKILDYFSYNGALLPLVAACGKSTFYNSLWIITILRVALFLIASLPTTILFYSYAVPEETLNVFFKNAPDFILWLSALTSSLCSLALIASIAELKKRYSITSLTYRYLPLVLCLFGTIVWAMSMFSSAQAAKSIQAIISCIPIVGISPIITSPLFNTNSTLVAAHSLLATCLVILLLRTNSKWFAAHLEEI